MNMNATILITGAGRGIGAACALLAAERGAWGVRVHDPAPTRAVLDVWDAWRAARS